MITLFQAEWCPYSAAVRERLTELGVDFVARQVEPDAAERREVDEIPTLETEDGTRYAGTDEVFGYLSRLEAWRFEREHRRQYDEHAAARRRETTRSVLEEKAPL